MAHIWVLQNQSDAYYTTLEQAEAEHGRLKLVFQVFDHDTGPMEPGEYYLPIPSLCPYSDQPCSGGGCSPCEYVPSH